MIVGLTYVGIAIGHWPKIKSNRATIVLMGTGLLLVTGQVAFKELPGLLVFDTLILLFSMMIINANLRLAGFFTLAGRTLLLVAFLVGVPVAEAAFLAACLLLFTRRMQPHLVFAEFDWGLLVFFAGLFIVSGTLERNGITAQLFNLISLTPQTNLWVFSGFTVILSNFVSNVPAVLLLKSVVVGMPTAGVGWMTLAVASTLAGNLTLLGSVANLIVAEIALRWRVELRFWDYTRAGVVITLLSLVTGLGWMQLFIWR